MTLSAGDNNGGSGLSKIVYTTDGTTPTATHGTVYANPFSVSTSPTTVKYRAFDNTGNAENTNSLTPDRHGHALVDDQVQRHELLGQLLQRTGLRDVLASDVGGSGVSAIVYTTDNSHA